MEWCGWHGSVSYFQTTAHPQVQLFPLWPNLRFGIGRDPARFSSCAPQSPAQTTVRSHNLVPRIPSGECDGESSCQSLWRPQRSGHTPLIQTRGKADIVRSFRPDLPKPTQVVLKLRCARAWIYAPYYLVQQELVNLIGSGAAYCAMTRCSRPILYS